MKRETRTAAGIAQALQCDRSWIKKRAKREGWIYRERKVPGGMRRYYLVEHLPADVQAALIPAPTPSSSPSGRGRGLKAPSSASGGGRDLNPPLTSPLPMRGEELKGVSPHEVRGSGREPSPHEGRGNFCGEETAPAGSTSLPADAPGASDACANTSALPPNGGEGDGVDPMVARQRALTWYQALPDAHRARVDARRELVRRVDEFVEAGMVSHPSQPPLRQGRSFGNHPSPQSSPHEGRGSDGESSPREGRGGDGESSPNGGEGAGNGRVSKTELIKEACRREGIPMTRYYRYRAAWERDGLYGLRDGRFGRNRSKLTTEQRAFIESNIKINPDVRAQRLYEWINMKWPESPVTSATVGRFLKQWKKEHHELYTLLRSPKAWKSKYQVAFGSESEKAKRFLHYVELDSSPSDVICADGRRYVLIGGIDIFSRKAKIIVNPTSNSAGIAALLREVIVDWGIPETIVIDNGKDYVSKHIESICETLDIHQHTVKPFSPEKKPHIERFFGTLTRGLFENLEGYIGHDVARRKEIEDRRSFAERFMRGGQTLEVHMTPDELQDIIDRWIEALYHQRRHGGIATTPEIRAAQSTVPVRVVEDERVLDLALMPVAEATVLKGRIRFQNADYRSPDLAGWGRERVQLRRDPVNAGKLYVFDLDGNYITAAWNNDLDEVPTAEYERARKARRRALNEQKRAIAALTGDPMTDYITEQERRRAVKGMNARRPASGRALEQAKDAALRGRGVTPDRHKSGAQKMRESGLDIQLPEEPDNYTLDWMDDIIVINE